MKQIGISATLAASRAPDEALSGLLAILDHLPNARILGPDEAKSVWLIGKTASGLPVSLVLGKVGDVIADTALGWRVEREGPALTSG